MPLLARVRVRGVVAELELQRKSPYGRAALHAEPGAPGPDWIVPSRWSVIEAPPAYRQRSKQRLLPSKITLITVADLPAWPNLGV